ncbi:MAG: hypothetical protein ABIE47_02070 [Pseudomonadota bacterium]
MPTPVAGFRSVYGPLSTAPTPVDSLSWFSPQTHYAIPSLLSAPDPGRRSALRLIQAEKRYGPVAIVEPGLFAMQTGVGLALYHRLAFFLYPGFPAGVAELAVAGRRGKWILAAVTGSELVGHGAPLG